MRLYYKFGGNDDIEGDQWEYEIDYQQKLEFYAFAKNITYEEALDEDEEVVDDYCKTHEEDMMEYFEDEAYDEYEYWK